MIIELSQGRRQFLAFIKKCWVFLVLSGLSYYLWHNYQQMVMAMRGIPPLNLLGAFVCVLFGKLASLYLMGASLKLQDIQLTGWRNHLWIYSSSDIAKYMPGGIWAIMGRLYHYRDIGLSTTRISRALLLENMGFVISALLLGLPVGLMLLSNQMGLMKILASLLLVFFVIGSLAVLRKICYPSSLKFRIKVTKVILSALSIMLLGWVAMGTSLFLLLGEHGTFYSWLWSIGSYTAAFIVGMAAVFAPAGAGIREGVLLLAGRLSGISETMILDAAIFNRGVWMVVDLCVFSFAILVRFFKK